MPTIRNEALIYEYVNKKELSSVEEKDFLYRLSMVDWYIIDEEYGEDFSIKILDKIKNTETKDLENLSNIILLYNNPYGKFTKEFGEVITNLYLKDKIRFIKSLHLVQDETINIVYVFRLEKIFPNDHIDDDLLYFENSPRLTEDEKETARMFFTMYRNICVSCL